MLWPREREQERDREGFRSVSLNPAQRGLEFLGAERAEHLAIGGDALVKLQSKVVRDEWSGAARIEVVQLCARLPPNDDGVLKPARGDQRRARPLTLQQGVGGNSGAVHDLGR